MAEVNGAPARGLVQRRMVADAHAPGRSRAAVRSLPLPAGRIDDVVVVVSELVTNSVMHAGDAPDRTVELRAELRLGTLRVEVTDWGAGFDPASVPRPGAAPGGRGLLAVHRLADRWGVGEGDPICTWAEFWLEGGLSWHTGGPDLPRGADGASSHRAGRAGLAALVAHRQWVGGALREAGRRRAQIERLIDLLRSRPETVSR